MFIIEEAHGQNRLSSFLQADAPADVLFSIQTEDGRSVYRKGEVVRLVLSFRTESPNRYRVWAQYRDRSGRSDLFDRFEVLPSSGWTDPLAEPGVLGGIAGGTGTNSDLTNTPTEISVTLNDWVRFDAPGTYSIRVTSFRVQDISASRVAAASNVLELTIEDPDPAWQSSTLAAALAAIDANGDPRSVETVSHLGTPEAAREMIRRLSGENSERDWHFFFGLAGSPSRQTVIEELERLAADPGFPVVEHLRRLEGIVGRPNSW